MTMRHPVPTLPRAAALCDLVLQDAPCPEQLDGRLRHELARRLAAAAPSRAHGPLRLDSWRVMNPIVDADSTPFAWSPSTARRLLGAPAARHVLEGARPTPLVAVRAEMARLIGVAAREPVRSGSLAMWLHEAPRGLRAQVLAEATGIIVSPGDLYGPTGAGAVRLAVVVPDAEFDVGLARLAG